MTYLQANYLKWMIPSYSAIGKQVTARFSSSDMIIIGISAVAIIALAITAHYGRSSAYPKEPASNFHAV